MRKKIIFTTSLLLFILTVYLKPTDGVDAFWPFDGWKKDGETQISNDYSFPPVIQRIIDKFNLNKDEVKNVMNDFRIEKQKDAQANFEEKLSQAVKDGKLTEEQKAKILEFHNKMQEQKVNWQSLMPTERKEKIQALKKEMQDWVNSQGINYRDFMGFGLMGGNKRFGRGFSMRGW
jgi:hypothetical protein